MNKKRVLLITGASSDVGNALIKKLYERYDAVWAHYCTSERMVTSQVAELGSRILPIQADFSCVSDTEKMISSIIESGYIPNHIIHLSSPKAKNLQFHKTSWNDFETSINTSFRSIVMILQKFLPFMAKQRYGKVVFMLSAYVVGVPPKFQSPYITAKYALLGLMRNLASEYAGKGISVNAISPDMMETKFLSELPELIIEKNAKSNPLGRNIRIGEIVPSIEYLLSAGSDVVTGQNIAVTGGWR